jgi:hypothetical protein
VSYRAVSLLSIIRNNQSIAALRKSVAFIALFGFLVLTFILLAAATFLGESMYVPIYLIPYSTTDDVESESKG